MAQAKYERGDRDGRVIRNNCALKKFMSNTKEEICIALGQERKVVLSLEKNRIYNVPDFQREIRWSCDNVALLIEDIKSGPKFLGNVILTKHSNNSFSIIDGQQRITVLTMILSSIRKLHEGEIEVILPCKLTIESFSCFSSLIEYGFEKAAYTEEVYESNKLKQIDKYSLLWEYISGLDEIKNRHEAKKIIENINAWNFNIIINEADDVGKGIRYFIDVNLKGKQLDVEDIFKSYLFRNDSSEEIRKQWYFLKTAVAEAENSKMEYTLLKLLEHYFLCDLYSGNNFKGMELGTDFFLKKPYKEQDRTYREGTHIIELINNNQYMKTSLERLNEIIRLMLLIVNSESLTKEITKVFSGAGFKIDNIELKIVHNFIGKILKDSKILPKALLIKYFIMLLYGNEEERKEHIRSIYGTYLFTVLFTIFENKKSADVLVSVIKADASQWYKELVKQIESYFVPEKITDGRLLAQYKFGQNEEEEDQRFRCKSLATIYNFFINQNGRICIRNGQMNNLYRFIADDDRFSIEHFIISESKNKKIKVEKNEYTIDDTIYRRYVNNFFNFIFIDKELNSDLCNNWLPKKLEILKSRSIICEYSKVVIKHVGKLAEEFQKRAGSDYKDKLDLFFHREYKELYIEYTKLVLEDIIRRIKGDEIGA